MRCALRALSYVALPAITATGAELPTAADYFASHTRELKWTLGPIVSSDLTRGSTGTTNEPATGLGFGAGLSLRVPVISGFALHLYGLYRTFTLTKTLSGSGVIEDPENTIYQQAYTGISGAALMSFLLSSSEDGEWWGEVGGEYLAPLSAAQTDAYAASGLGGTVALTETSPFIFAIVGLSGDYPLSRDFDLRVSLHGFYHVTAATDTSYWGVRMVAGTQFRF